VLHFNKLHDSVCTDNSWSDCKFWQHFYQTFTNFCPYFLRV